MCTCSSLLSLPHSADSALVFAGNVCVSAPPLDMDASCSERPGSPSASDTTEPVDLASSSPLSLHRAVYARRAEYTRPHRIRVKVGTWNVAACPGTDKDLASWFVDGKGVDTRWASPDLPRNPAAETRPGSLNLLGGDKVGLYVLGLQEVVNLNPVTQYVYAETNPTDKWRQALEAALPDGYQFVTSEQMSGLLLLIYASPDVASSVSNISKRVVGTGVGGWFGNKGATVARIVLGDATKMVFVNSHLSSGSDLSSMERRFWDARTIMDRPRFDPIVLAGDDREDNQDRIGDEDFIFWFGDLNFRLDGIPGDDIRRLLTLHTSGEYNLSNPDSGHLGGEDGVMVNKSSAATDNERTEHASGEASASDHCSDDDSVTLPDPDDFEPDPHGDPASLQATLDSLLPHDQLLRSTKQCKIFHDGWHEGPITFLPSYKYDVGSIGLFDSSEKKRAPSWCDRILYRTRRDKDQYEMKIKEEEDARKRDEEMKARGIDHAGDDDEVLFDYDPENDGESVPSGKPGLDYDEYDDGGDDEGLVTVDEEDATDRTKLEVYTSHQRITSSDHKPVVAIFTVDFDAVVPELKAEVLADVARGLDRAENEGRPTITIATEGARPGDDSVDFGHVRYLEKRSAYLTLANTGRVAASISFVKDSTTNVAGDEAGVPHWLTTSLSGAEQSDTLDEVSDAGSEVTLEPGDTVNATIEILVNNVAQAKMLNDDRASLEEVLVLRVADGRDHFIPVRAIWLPTCIGRSIDELIRVPDGGIRAFVASLNRSEPAKHKGAIPYGADIHRSAPKELFKLIEAVEILLDRTMADEDMLGSYNIPKDKHGWPFEDAVAGPHEALLADVVEVLDTDRPITDAFPAEINPCQRLETVTDVLLMFLEGLVDGVISRALWSKIEQAPIRALGQASTTPSSTAGIRSDSSEDDRTAILDILTNAPHNNICFVFLTTTLAKVLAEIAPLTKSDIEVLAATRVQQTGAMGAMGAIGALGRRSLSFRRSVTLGQVATGTSTIEAVSALERRKARERRVAQIFGKVVCRAPIFARDKDRKVLEGKQTTVMELFLRKQEGA